MSSFRKTKGRLEIINKMHNGAEVFLTKGFAKPKLAFKNGVSIGDKTAEDLLKSGFLIPSNDGLFKGDGQTMRLSQKAIKWLEDA